MICLSQRFNVVSAPAQLTDREAVARGALTDKGAGIVGPESCRAARLQKPGDEVAVKLIQGGKISSKLHTRVQSVVEE